MGSCENFTRSDNLKPCPFCGGADAYVAFTEADEAYVSCFFCGAEGPYATLNEAEAQCSTIEELAVHKWNTRRLHLSDCI